MDKRMKNDNNSRSDANSNKKNCDSNDRHNYKDTNNDDKNRENNLMRPSTPKPDFSQAHQQEPQGPKQETMAISCVNFIFCGGIGGEEEVVREGGVGRWEGAAPQCDFRKSGQ